MFCIWECKLSREVNLKYQYNTTRKYQSTLQQKQQLIYCIHQNVEVLLPLISLDLTYSFLPYPTKT